jgi:disulfide bond formation protein DsbB
VSSVRADPIIVTDAAIASPAAALPRLRAANWLALLVPASLLGGALASQYLGGLAPCEMCYWQRWPHGAAIAFAALAFVLPSQTRILTLLAAAAIAVSGIIGVYHAGVEAGIFEGLTTCTATGAGSLADIMATPLVRCDQIQFAFLGISMAGWNAVLSLGSAIVVSWLVWSDRK